MDEVKEVFRYVDCEDSQDIADYKLVKYSVVRETAKGYWIHDLSELKFMRKKAKKLFACLTEEEALKQYILRKMHQVRILEEKLCKTKLRLNLALEKRKKQVEESCPS